MGGPIGGAVYIAGVQPVGGRGVGGVQPVVAVSRPAAATDEATTMSSRAAVTGQVARNVVVEGQAVVFRRGGPSIDWRPLELRRREAEDRYREADGLLDDETDEETDDHDADAARW